MAIWFYVFPHPGTWNQKQGYLNLSPCFPVPYYQTTRLPYCSPPVLCPTYAGQGISKPLMVGKRHDTDSRWRQLTKLPRPCPQYPPFTLGNGIFWFSLRRIMAVPASPQCRLQTLRVIARAFDVILLTGQLWKQSCRPTHLPQAVTAPAPGLLAVCTAPLSRETRILIL